MTRKKKLLYKTRSIERKREMKKNVQEETHNNDKYMYTFFFPLFRIDTLISIT